MLHGSIVIRILMFWNVNVGGKFSGIKMLLSDLLEWRNVETVKADKNDGIFTVILLISLISIINRTTEDNLLKY